MHFKKILNSFESRLEKIFNFFEEHFFLTIITLFVLSLAVRLYLTPYRIVLRKDSFGYLMHSLEMVKGSFSPRLSSPSGWPLFMYPFLYLFGSKSIFQNMIYTRVISNFVGVFSIFPLACIGRKLLDKKSLLLLLVMFAFTSELIMSSILAGTESLFIFLLLMVILFIIKARENRNYILVASLFGALAYYVRFNGIFILLIILFSFFFLRKGIPQFSYKYMAYIVLIFFIVSVPFLYQRHVYFGSPFFYGEVSKYFVDSYQEFFSYNIPVPSLIDYLKTHTVTDYFNKFFIHGFLLILVNYLCFVIPPPLLFFFFYGVVKHFNSKMFMPLIFVLLAWVISFIPVWGSSSAPRLLYPTIPFILVFSAIALNDLFKDYKYEHGLLSLFLIVFVIFSLMTPALYKYYSLSNEQDELEWGKWIAENIKGKIAMFNGDLVIMHLSDRKFGDTRQFTDLYSSKANLSVMMPGYFKNLSSALKWYQRVGITHFALDDATINRRPYFKEIYSKKDIPSYLTEVYSNYDTDSNWKMRVYSFNHSEYLKSGITDKLKLVQRNFIGNYLK